MGAVVVMVVGLGPILVVGAVMVLVLGAGDPHGPGVIPVGAGDRRGDIPAGEVVWHGVLPTMLPTVAVPGKAYVTDTPVSPIIHVQALAEPMGTIEFLLAR